MNKVEKSKWHVAADLLSRKIHGQHARMEIVSASLGDQVQTEWAPLLGVTYEPREDLFEIRFEGLDHLVSHPTLFGIRERDGLADSLAVIDREGIEHILKLREPIALPPVPLEEDEGRGLEDRF